MRMPGRLQITWQDDRTLKVDIEAGTQSRLFRFMGTPAQDMMQSGATDIQGLSADMYKPSLQGLSLATWEYAGGRGNLPQPRPEKMNLGDLKVVTKYAKPGYLQKNGVPYSGDMVQTEYFSRTYEDNGDSWLILTQVIEDPTYLRARYARSTHYKKLPDNNTTWEPEACSAK